MLNPVIAMPTVPREVGYPPLKILLFTSKMHSKHKINPETEQIPATIVPTFLPFKFEI